MPFGVVICNMIWLCSFCCCFLIKFDKKVWICFILFRENNTSIIIVVLLYHFVSVSMTLVFLHHVGHHVFSHSINVMEITMPREAARPDLFSVRRAHASCPQDVSEWDKHLFFFASFQYVMSLWSGCLNQPVVWPVEECLHLLLYSYDLCFPVFICTLEICRKTYFNVN